MILNNVERNESTKRFDDYICNTNDDLMALAMSEVSDYLSSEGNRQKKENDIWMTLGFCTTNVVREMEVLYV